MMQFKLIAFIIALVLAGIVVLQNTAQVDTHILFVTVAMPRAVLLALTFALGLLAGLLIAWRRRKSHKADVMEQVLPEKVSDDP